MDVTLTWAESAFAAYVGVRRRLHSLKDGRKIDPGRRTVEIWGADVEGALGEYVVAKGFDVPWEASIDTFKKPDVNGWQVRATSLENGCLVIRPDDKEKDPYVLVTGLPPDFKIRGWLWGYEARQEKWVKAPNNRFPAWFVPQSELHGLPTLLKSTVPVATRPHRAISERS